MRAHFCFFVGYVYLQSLRKSKAELSLFLLKRGLWLVVAEGLIVSLGISFLPYNFILLQVIWAIGVSMVLMAAVIRLPFRAILIIGLVIVLGHNALDFVEAAPDFKPSLVGVAASCAGGLGVAVGLSNSQSGVNYQLKLNGNNSGSVAGTGGAPPTVTPGPNKTVTFGFGSNCTNLTAMASGTGPFGYAWNNNAGNTATVNVCPQAKTTYTVTATMATAARPRPK